MTTQVPSDNVGCLGRLLPGRSKKRISPATPSVSPDEPSPPAEIVQGEHCVDVPPSGQSLPERQDLRVKYPVIAADGTFQTWGQSTQPLTGDLREMWSIGQHLRVRVTGGSDPLRQRVRDIALEWTRHANIVFEFVGANDPADIRVEINSGGRSWSALGRQATQWWRFDSPTMMIGLEGTPATDERWRRVVLHEFGHALGMIHEHQAPGAPYEWNKEVVYDEMKTWSKEEVDRNIFEKYDGPTTTNSVYDPDSIMHYWIPDHWIKSGSPVVKPNNNLSPTDIDLIEQWYPFAPDPSRPNGVLRTGDDCDEIQFSVEYATIDMNRVQVRLEAAPRVKWWKKVSVPTVGGGRTNLEIQDGRVADVEMNAGSVDLTRPLGFGKAKEFGIKTDLSFTWPSQALLGGTRLTLRWVRESCSQRP